MTIAIHPTTHSSGLTRGLIDARGPRVMAHRGTAGTTVAENSSRAALAAILSGADVVEIDVVASRDGVFYAFHDGEEKRLLGRDIHLLKMDARQIASERFVHVHPTDGEAAIETIATVLNSVWKRFPDAIINLDRSWNHWTTFLPFLDQFPRTNQIILKSHVEGDHWQELQRHSVKYPYVGICQSLGDVETLLALSGVNVIGAELIAVDEKSPFLDPALLDSLKSRGLVLVANSEVMKDGAALFAGHDDDASLFEDSTRGWNHLLDLGFDVIQTDWPWLLRQAIETRSSAGEAADTIPSEK